MPYLLENAPVEFRNRPLLFIDLEMTGLDAEKHEIIEVAALRVRQPDFVVENSYYTKVTPTHIETADPKALRLLRYSDESWKEGIPLKQVLQELSDFAPGCMLAGWSVQNEWDFLNAALKQHGLPYFYTHHLIEVFSLAYSKFYSRTDIPFLNLPNVARALNIYLDQHKPDSDVRATYEIFKALVG